MNKNSNNSCSFYILGWDAWYSVLEPLEFVGMCSRVLMFLVDWWSAYYFFFPSGCFFSSSLWGSSFSWLSCGGVFVLFGCFVGIFLLFVVWIIIFFVIFGYLICVALVVFDSDYELNIYIIVTSFSYDNKFHIIKRLYNRKMLA
jgi:hypothetical protein